MSKRNIAFCTYFDKNYLLKGITMLSSFLKFHSGANFWVLCLDDYTENIINKLKIPGVIPIKLEEFEKENKELLAIKQTRNKVEYYWTCSPLLPLYVFDKNKNTKFVVYLDADLFFCSSMDSVFKELADRSIYTVEHRFPCGQESRIKRSGRFNVGFQIYKRDAEAFSCLNRWKNQCLSWCYGRLENEKYGDQLYLNEWPSLYKNLVISKNLGVDTAPWNIGQYKLIKKNGDLYINKDKLICYHFHQFDVLGENKFGRSSGYRLSDKVIEYIYKPYEDEINRQIKIIKSIDDNFTIIPPRQNIFLSLRNAFIRLAGPIYWRIKI